MRKTIIAALIALPLFYFSGCSGKRDSSLLPEATGRPGNIILIMDSVQWKGTLGDTLRGILLQEVPGLPRTESMFDVKCIQPDSRISLLTQIRNLIYVFTLDQTTSGSRKIRENFTPETIEKIKSDSGFYISTSEDEYSRGQRVMYLFGDTQENLIRHLDQNRAKITEFFNLLERNRLIVAQSKTSSTRKLTEALKKKEQCEIKLPAGFKIADQQSDFVWFRQPEIDIDKNIFISWKPYERETQLETDSIIHWRDAIAARYLFEDPDRIDTHLETETTVPFKPVISRKLIMNDNYAVELRGLWKTSNNTMGGPFISYAIVDKDSGRLYYIEGFTYSPGKRQREIVRELEAILWTFKPLKDTAPEH